MFLSWKILQKMDNDWGYPQYPPVARKDFVDVDVVSLSAAMNLFAKAGWKKLEASGRIWCKVGRKGIHHPQPSAFL